MIPSGRIGTPGIGERVPGRSGMPHVLKGGAQTKPRGNAPILMVFWGKIHVFGTTYSSLFHLDL